MLKIKEETTIFQKVEFIFPLSKEDWQQINRSVKTLKKDLDTHLHQKMLEELKILATPPVVETIN